MLLLLIPLSKLNQRITASHMPTILPSKLRRSCSLVPEFLSLESPMKVASRTRNGQMPSQSPRMMRRTLLPHLVGKPSASVSESKNSSLRLTNASLRLPSVAAEVASVEAVVVAMVLAEEVMDSVEAVENEAIIVVTTVVNTEVNTVVAHALAAMVLTEAVTLVVHALPLLARLPSTLRTPALSQAWERKSFDQSSLERSPS
jgi:hypothetical protein